MNKGKNFPYLCEDKIAAIMPHISNTAEIMPESAIRKLTPYADQAKGDGIKIYHLNIGSPDIKSPEGAYDAVHNYVFDHLPYSNSAGTYSLRNAIVEKYYKRIGINIDINDMLVTVAGSEALTMVFQAACDPDDEVLVMEPFYCNYNTFTLMNRVKLVAVHTDIKDGFKVPPIEEFEKVMTPRTKAVLLCNPGNPTGTLYTKKDMLAIGELCRKHDIFLISDEAYREFCYTEEPYFSAMQIPNLKENVILVDSASKRYNLCGARIGCIVSHNRAVIKLITKIAQARLCPPVLGQVATYGALSATPEYFEKVREEYIARRDYTIERLNRMDGVFSPKPMGAFYTVAELPVDDTEKFAKWLLTDFRVNNETVMITPAEPFYKTPGIGKNQARIAYVLEVPALKKALDILEKGLKKYNSLDKNGIQRRNRHKA